jgi:DNA-binding NarL/FixJ family response regulator
VVAFATRGEAARLARHLTDNGLEPVLSTHDLDVLAAVEDVDLVIIATPFADDVTTLVGAARELLTDAAVIVVAATSTPRDLRTILASGADGIVSDDDLASALVPTVAAVAAGQLVLPREAWRRTEKPQLSRREKQILAMVVLGFGNGEIARKLFVTEATVKSHLSSAFSKLGVRSRTEATALILDPEHGLGTGILAISEGAG